ANPTVSNSSHFTVFSNSLEIRSPAAFLLSLHPAQELWSTTSAILLELNWQMKVEFWHPGPPDLFGNEGHCYIHCLHLLL
ncbi:hypothetical protein A6R68_02579, partial [Neotoma lepida]